MCFFEQKDYQKALEDAKQCSRLRFHFIDPYFLIGKIHVRLGQFQEAKNIYKKALIYDPDNEELKNSKKNLENMLYFDQLSIEVKANDDPTYSIDTQKDFNINNNIIATDTQICSNTEERFGKGKQSKILSTEIEEDDTMTVSKFEDKSSKISQIDKLSSHNERWKKRTNRYDKNKDTNTDTKFISKFDLIMSNTINQTITQNDIDKNINDDKIYQNKNCNKTYINNKDDKIDKKKTQ